MKNIPQLREELEKWKEQCEEEEKRKSNTTLAKLEADDLHKEAEQRLTELLDRSSEIERARNTSQNLHQMEMKDLQMERDVLTGNMEELDCQIKQCRKEFERRRSELQVDNKLPHKNVNFTKEDCDSAKLSNICYTCQIVVQCPYTLLGGQALLTFENKEVAQGIIDNERHNVEFNNGYEEVTASRVQLGRTVTFEVNMDISNTKVKVINLPTDLPEETLKDKLELIFYKSNIGGGEIESVEYKRSNNSACIAYKEAGVAQRVLKKSVHLLTAGRTVYEIGIAPVIEKQLNKLQIFSGICHRTVLVEIRNQMDPEDDIKDLVEIHFQKPSNGGGEVDCVAFSMKNKLAHFEDDTA
ncbi:Interferon-induced 35 kDa protein (IFP 35) N-terminus [Pristimantis euphronides]